MVESPLARPASAAPDPLGRVFQALADPTRRGMLAMLEAGERTVGELAAPLPISLAAASKHVKVLEGAGLLSRTVAGRRHVCRLEAAPLARANAWLRHYERFWSERLVALEDALAQDGGAAPTAPANPAPEDRARHGPGLEERGDP